MDGEIAEIGRVLADCSVNIHRAVAESPIVSEKSGQVNVSGDEVLALDELADALVEEALKACPLISGFASEERESFVALNEGGKYIVVFDPLDGSQNVPVGICVGTIYGVFAATRLEDINSGRDMVAAGYALHSASLVFAYSCGNQTSLQQFIGGSWAPLMTNHQIPAKGKTYCINEASTEYWDLTVTEFVRRIKKGRSIRWTCCMVVDVHRPLVQGGCFLYPADTRYPQGRLRLVYEAYPLAFMWEASGGLAFASSEGERILDREFPHENVHTRVGIIMLGQEEAKVFEDARQAVEE